jgi:uncharacterized protein YbaR (Trm112 family)
VLIPLIDSLRCPNAHDETWLVASIDRAVERDMLEGTLGCPKCLAEYPVRDGIVRFADVPRAPFMAPSEREATRIAAALDLTDPRMTAVLYGLWGAHAPLVRARAPAALILVNPPEGVVTGDGISIVLAESPPLAIASMDGAAVDAAAGDAVAAALRSTLKGGRRMLGPASLAVPAFLEELARDDDVWVARLEPGAVTSAPVTPTLRRRTENR